jgi:hypothetical protein
VRYTWVHATFKAVGPGLTFDNPIRIGTRASIGQGWSAQVNSVTPNFDTWNSPQPPPPPGAEYFVANVTMAYDGGSSDQVRGPSQVEGRHKTTYTTARNGCPDSLNKAFPDGQTVYSGQSVTGNVCWTIAANDASSLELYFGFGGSSSPGTTWFALH